MGGAPLAEGTTLGAYEITGRLGVGAMGTVYRARDARLGREVALKVVRPDLADDVRFAERFLQEARLAARIDHPHVVTVFEAGEDDGQLYLAMRLVDGPDLRGLLRRDGPLEPQRAARICDQIAGALDTAHAANLVHRDVKPANVLLGSHRGNDHAHLADFGVARAVDATAGTATRNGFVGTLSYIAPEVIDGAAPGPAADVYALACTAFQAMSGRPPFDYPTEGALLWAHVHETPPALSSLAPVPSDVDDVLAWALAKDPGERPGTAELFTTALLGALTPGDVTVRRPAPRAPASVGPLDDTLVPATPPEAPTEVATRPRGTRWLAPAAAVLVGGVAGVLAVSALGEEDAPVTTSTASSVVAVRSDLWKPAVTGTGELTGLGLTARVSLARDDGAAATAGRFTLGEGDSLRSPFSEVTRDAFEGRGTQRAARIAGRVAMVLSGRSGDAGAAVVLRATDRGLVGFSCAAPSPTTATTSCLDLAAGARLTGARSIDLGAEPAVARMLDDALTPLRRVLTEEDDALSSSGADTRTAALEQLAARARRARSALRPQSASPPVRPALIALRDGLGSLGHAAGRKDPRAAEVEAALGDVRDALSALRDFGYRTGA